MGGTKCEKACNWNIAVVSIKWLTDVILGDLSALKLPVNLCYANVTGDESFSVDLNKVFHLLGTLTVHTSLSRIWDHFFTARCTLVQSAVLLSYVVRPSVCPLVCPCVTFRYHDHIGWNSSKIILRPNSLRPLLGLTPTWAIWCNGNTPKIGAE